MPYGCRTCVRCRRRQSVKPSPLPPMKPKLIPNRPTDRRSRSYSSSMTDNKQADTAAAAANSKLSSLSYSSSLLPSLLLYHGQRTFCATSSAATTALSAPLQRPQEILGEIWRVKISNLTVILGYFIVGCCNNFCPFLIY